MAVLATSCEAERSSLAAAHLASCHVAAGQGSVGPDGPRLCLTHTLYHVFLTHTHTLVCVCLTHILASFSPPQGEDVVAGIRTPKDVSHVSSARAVRQVAACWRRGADCSSAAMMASVAAVPSHVLMSRHPFVDACAPADHALPLPLHPLVQMAENFPQAYEDLVANTTLLEKHMRDMQVRAVPSPDVACLGTAPEGPPPMRIACSSVQHRLYTAPCPAGLRQHPALWPLAGPSRRTASSRCRTASCTCCRRATASARAPPPCRCAQPGRGGVVPAAPSTLDSACAPSVQMPLAMVWCTEGHAVQAWQPHSASFVLKTLMPACACSHLLHRWLWTWRTRAWCPRARRC